MKELQTAQESLFWYWISERHSIYLRRLRGQPKPWTTDPILQQYKFTNPFRENDRGTVWLRQNFLGPHRDDPLALIAFNICWYRMFNWWGTGEFLGWQTSWNTYDIAWRLLERLDADQQVFTGAHIVYSRPGVSKVNAIVNVCGDLWNLRDNLAYIARSDRKLEAVYQRLIEVDCVGPFMAYEMVTDMRHTRLLNDATDILTWANPGPGAIRGLRRLSYPWKPRLQAIESMRILLSHAHYVCGSFPVPPEVMPKDFPAFEMRDIEHSLCEFDKYCRVKFGEGEPRAKYNGT